MRFLSDINALERAQDRAPVDQPRNCIEKFPAMSPGCCVLAVRDSQGEVGLMVIAKEADVDEALAESLLRHVRAHDPHSRDHITLLG